MEKVVDPLFKVVKLEGTPQQLFWLALHQDYSENFVGDIDPVDYPSDEKAGEIVNRLLLKGGKGHFGPLEHGGITLAAGFFPHDVMVQARTHRIATFDVQSSRYTGDRILRMLQAVDVIAEGKEIVELEGNRLESCFLIIGSIFYVPPAGTVMVSRDGTKFTMTDYARYRRLVWCHQTAESYREAINEGEPYESARRYLAQGLRQHFVFSFNARSLMHFLDLRLKADAQSEIVTFSEMILPHFRSYCPQVAEWYEENRKGKARLAP